MKYSQPLLARTCGPALIVFAMIGSSGCAKVPVQAVVLSRTVGERLSDLQASHEAFVSAYFLLSRQRVEDFLNQRWIPTFLGKFVEGSDLMGKLQNVQPLTPEQDARLQTKLREAGISSADQAKVMQAISSAFGDPDRGKLVLLFSEAALKQIQLKRKSLVEPLDQLERTTLDELRRAYAQVQQAQGTVTAHLSSIQKVTQEQDQVLERLGLLKSRDAIIEKAVQTNEKIMGILDAGEGAEKTVEQLEDLIKQLKKPVAEGNQPNR